MTQVMTAATLRPAGHPDDVAVPSLAASAGGALPAAGEPAATGGSVGAGGPSAAGEVDGRGGRDGVHTPALDEVLAEMQALARSMPGSVW
jgi:ring-1,2-phenylacetyl-CoA epoxidase subunit PaaC